MSPGLRAGRHLAPYVLGVVAGLLLLGFGLATWGSDERASAAALTGPCLVLAWGRPLVRKVKVLNAKVPTLQIDEDGVNVAYGKVEEVRYARLAWEDCAAVVACRLRSHKGTRAQYVAFLPVDEARVEGDAGSAPARSRARSLRVGPAQALMTWLDPFGQRPGVDEVLAEVRRTRPDVPVKDLR